MPKKSGPTIDIADGRRFQLFFDELNKETDRGAVLLAAAWIETLLGDILASVLRPKAKSDVPDLLDGKARQPLGSFSARTDIAYRLGLIDAEFFSALYYLRRLRNDFAHVIDKPGDLTAKEHQPNLDGLLQPFLKSKAFTTFFANEKSGEVFVALLPPIKFRQAASYILGRLRAMHGWVGNNERLDNVQLFTRNYPPQQGGAGAV